MEIISATTTRGKVKQFNEDVFGLKSRLHSTIVCLCDGHWGKLAANLVCSSLLANFPVSRKQAISQLNLLQSKLFKLQKKPDPPETSLLAIKFNTSKLTLKFLSYGDCRLLIVRNNKIFFTLPTKPTWLGALSYKEVRDRLPLSKGLIYGTFKLSSGDRIFLFTDGVDECVYETPTIPHSWLIRHSPSQIFNRIGKSGAQDNASLIIIRC